MTTEPENTPTPEPANTPDPPATEPDKGATYWQSQFDKSQNTIADLQAQLESLQAEARPPAEPTEPGSQPKPDLPEVNWEDKSTWFAEDQSGFNSAISERLKHAGIPEQIIADMGYRGVVSEQILQDNARQQAESIFKTMDNCRNAQEYLKEKDPTQYRAIEKMLNDPLQYKAGLQLLAMNTEDIPADKVNTPQGNTPDPKEPSKIPESSGSGAPAITPLKQGSVELRDAVSDPRYYTDPEYQKQVAERIKLGARLQ